MNNNIVQLKLKQRLNKLDSADYDNVQTWQIVEAFNKGQVSWCRRNLHGLNIKQTGDEQSKRRIDDLQILLKDSPKLKVEKKSLYMQTEFLPEDYFEWKRLSANAIDSCCPGKRKMIIYLSEEGNIDEVLRDKNKQPSYAWGETVCTLKGNKISVYTNDEFTVEDAILTYYRQPRYIEIKGTVDPYTQKTSDRDIECEFKDDMVELFIDEAAKILAGDLESINQQQTAAGQVEGNN